MPMSAFGNGAAEMNEDRTVVPMPSSPPPSSPGGGGGRDDLADRMTRLETEFKEVVKKSDLLEETQRLDRRIQEAVDKVKSATNSMWVRNLGAIGIFLTLCIAAYSAFFK